MPINKNLQLLALTQELDEAKARLSVVDEVLLDPLDNYAVQSCCICYGGNSFPGPMKDALKCLMEIIHSRIDAKLNPLP